MITDSKVNFNLMSYGNAKDCFLGNWLVSIISPIPILYQCIPLVAISIVDWLSVNELFDVIKWKIMYRRVKAMVIKIYKQWLIDTIAIKMTDCDVLK